ncbi:MAG: DUF1156 domain-containing protein [Gammaproteobacteria bacterium]|nr:DUF1156 domain-containing protein [Gammaproteobacteria bacterium]
MAAGPKENGDFQPAAAWLDPDAPSFIETQFPVSKLSKESYKERKGNASQTLTGLGKWWGRKPLVMVRAVILGLLMPASENPRRDLKIFLALMTMDAEGLWRRKTKNIPLRDVFMQLSAEERDEWFDQGDNPTRPKLKRRLDSAKRKELQRIVFDRMSYDEKLKWCDRPEQIDGPSPEAWRAINEHLGTSSNSLADLVQELGTRRFGRIPRVGDAFCGGGSIPFEAARLGCEAFGSDLNPVAALLTWGALNIVGGGQDVAERVRQAQTDAFDALDRQVTAWRIEHNDVGWRADSFLYCTETVCPECGWRVPLAPSWVIGEKTRTVARLVPRPEDRAFGITIHSAVDPDATAQARRAGTLKGSRLDCPHCCESTSIAAIRGDRREKDGRGRGLRLWEDDDLAPRPDDVFQERLYCVRWRLPSLADLLAQQLGRPVDAPVPDWVSLDAAINALAELLDTENQQCLARLRQLDQRAVDKALEDAQTIAKALPKSVYRAVTDADLERETLAMTLLRERFHEWQRLGYIPSRRIPPGAKTDEPIGTRGWTHWHHLFTPRQLLVHGLLADLSEKTPISQDGAAACLLGIGRVADWDSRLARWWTDKSHEKVVQTFSNQALNTLATFGSRGVLAMDDSWFLAPRNYATHQRSITEPADSRSLRRPADVWITDPPYADAVNYHELSEFFLAWYEKRLTSLFPDWYTDSKRALAVQGSGADFRSSMVASYRNLATNMAENGYQVVMFTHQDAAIWADLTLILWASGLRVTTAWTIGTETPFGVKEGNYVQGTVLMVLRKQTSEETAFLDELVPEVEAEVERQLDNMLALDDREEPNFSDADYQLAAYAAALRVLTQYSAIEDIDIARELAREPDPAMVNPIETIIEDAVRTASNVRVPAGLGDARALWLQLGAEERLYLKGLEVESHGDYRAGVYQEFARGFGVRDYRVLLHTGKANETRLKTASELGRSDLGSSTFGTSLVRHALYATWRATETEAVTESLTWLRDELPDYWNSREPLITILRYLAATEASNWRDDATAARIVAGAVENDHV